MDGQTDEQTMRVYGYSFLLGAVSGPLRASTKENGVFGGAFLAVFGPWGGIPWSESGGMVVQDTEFGG